MGQTLSEPVVDKHTSSGGDERLIWAVSEMQGWRLTMEDAHAHVLALGDEKDGPKAAYFAVYDGHGGSSVARFAGDTVHQRLAASDVFKSRDYEASLKRAFLATDEDLRANPDFRGDPSGCTAVATLITADNRVICANAGDSRSVMSVGGEAKPISFDHKPTNKGESSRITAAGGFVEFGRVNGNLALSRAIGDFEFKQNTGLSPEQQIVTADPDITVHDPTDEDEFVVLACDGIWDVLTSQQVIDFVRRGIAARKELQVICEELMDRCLAPDSDWGGVGCDNMTAMIVGLLRGKTKEQWYDWVAERVEKKIGYETPAETPDPFASGPRNSFAARPPGVLGGAGGPSSDEDFDDSGSGHTLDLPTIQAALRAQGIHISTPFDATGEDSSSDDVEMDQVEHSSLPKEDEEEDVAGAAPSTTTSSSSNSNNNNTSSTASASSSSGPSALVANGHESDEKTTLSPPEQQQERP